MPNVTPMPYVMEPEDIAVHYPGNPVNAESVNTSRSRPSSHRYNHRASRVFSQPEYSAETPTRSSRHMITGTNRFVHWFIEGNLLTLMDIKVLQFCKCFSYFTVHILSMNLLFHIWLWRRFVTTWSLLEKVSCLASFDMSKKPFCISTYCIRHINHFVHDKLPTFLMQSFIL